MFTEIITTSQCREVIDKILHADGHNELLEIATDASFCEISQVYAMTTNINGFLPPVIIQSQIMKKTHEEICSEIEKRASGQKCKTNSINVKLKMINQIFISGIILHFSKRKYERMLYSEEENALYLSAFRTFAGGHCLVFPRCIDVADDPGCCAVSCDKQAACCQRKLDRMFFESYSGGLKDSLEGKSNQSTISFFNNKYLGGNGGLFGCCCCVPYFVVYFALCMPFIGCFGPTKRQVPNTLNAQLNVETALRPMPNIQRPNTLQTIKQNAELIGAVDITEPLLGGNGLMERIKTGSERRRARANAIARMRGEFVSGNTNDAFKLSMSAIMNEGTNSISSVITTQPTTIYDLPGNHIEQGRTIVAQPFSAQHGGEFLNDENFHKAGLNLGDAVSCHDKLAAARMNIAKREEKLRMGMSVNPGLDKAINDDIGKKIVVAGGVQRDPRPYSNKGLNFDAMF